MKPKRTPYNSSWQHGITYQGQTFSGPQALHDAADPARRVSSATFNARLRSRKKRGHALTDSVLEECLYLAPNIYRQRYGQRQTLIQASATILNIGEFYKQHTPKITYTAFRQRMKRLERDCLLSDPAIHDALTLKQSDWISFYGGGRRKEYMYEGDLYSQYRGQRFSSISAFLKSIGRYDERGTVWDRLKAHWPMDTALDEPVLPRTVRKGCIYKITRKKTGQLYVGLTICTSEARWQQHLKRAADGASTPLASAIREDGAAGFLLEVLESGIPYAHLGLLERKWIKQLNTRYPHGLNGNDGGTIGGGYRKSVIYGGKKYPSLTEAAAILGERDGLALHVVERRIRQGLPLPAKARVKSNHPEAGSRLWRLWKSLLNATSKGVRKGEVCHEWLDYDQFKQDVLCIAHDTSDKLVRRDQQKHWGPGNVAWVAPRECVKRIHSKRLLVFGIEYKGYNELAETYGVSASTLKYRINSLDLSPEAAVTQQLGPTSIKQVIPIMIDGRTFRSTTDAARQLAPIYGLTFDQARDRLRRNVPLTQ